MLDPPDRIHRLGELARDLWWSWNPDARNVFRRLDYPLWRVTAHNPVNMLALVPGESVAKALASPSWLALYDSAVLAGLDAARQSETTWLARDHPGCRGTIAYFSAEFGVHNSLKIYSGGLGILAGDHCKSASDLGVPLVGVGFMYPEGYVVQKISADGWQQNVYESVNWGVSPVRPVFEALGRPHAARQSRSAAAP